MYMPTDLALGEHRQASESEWVPKRERKDKNARGRERESWTGRQAPNHPKLDTPIKRARTCVPK